MLAPSIVVPERALHDHTIVLMCATFKSSNRPLYVAARFSGPYQGDPPVHFPAYVKMQKRVIYAHGLTRDWHVFNCGLARADGLPGASDTGRKRYQTFIERIVAAGCIIEWQVAPGRGYATRASLERALIPFGTAPFELTSQPGRYGD